MDAQATGQEVEVGGPGQVKRRTDPEKVRRRLAKWQRRYRQSEAHNPFSAALYSSSTTYYLFS
eukprot:c28581_g1_i1 orf=3-188(-)